MDRNSEAFKAVRRIMRKLDEVDFDWLDPDYSVYNIELPDGIYFASGATRIVIWDDYNDYVLKIARSKSCEKYNELEVAIYESAVQADLEDNFGWCACYEEAVMDADYVPGIYVMEFLCCDEDAVADSVWDWEFHTYCEQTGRDGSSIETIDDFNDSYWGGTNNDSIMDYFETLIEEDKRQLFYKFLRFWHINDLHEANYGFDENNRLVICDYAGFGW